MTPLAIAQRFTREYHLRRERDPSPHAAPRYYWPDPDEPDVLIPIRLLPELARHLRDTVGPTAPRDPALLHAVLHHLRTTARPMPRPPARNPRRNASSPLWARLWGHERRLPNDLAILEWLIPAIDAPDGTPVTSIQQQADRVGHAWADVVRLARRLHTHVHALADGSRWSALPADPRTPSTPLSRYAASRYATRMWLEDAFPVGTTLLASSLLRQAQSAHHSPHVIREIALHELAVQVHGPKTARLWTRPIQ